jgi:hypothetical protein
VIDTVAPAVLPLAATAPSPAALAKRPTPRAQVETDRHLEPCRMKPGIEPPSLELAQLIARTLSGSSGSPLSSRLQARGFKAGRVSGV